MSFQPKWPGTVATRRAPSMMPWSIVTFGSAGQICARVSSCRGVSQSAAMRRRPACSSGNWQASSSSSAAVRQTNIPAFQR